MTLFIETFIKLIERHTCKLATHGICDVQDIYALSKKC